MRFLKPVNQKVLEKAVYKPNPGPNGFLSVQGAIENFEEAAWQFTDRQLINLYANIISTRAEKLGGGQFIDGVIKELERRKPFVIESMLE